MHDHQQVDPSWFIGQLVLPGMNERGAQRQEAGSWFSIRHKRPERKKPC
ncbi:MAG: hypothetical protein ACJ8GO_13660 [Ramlibacter sp.]